MSEVRVRDGDPQQTCPALGLWLLQLYRLRSKIRRLVLAAAADPRERSIYLTLIANLPGTLIPIRRATSELDASKTTTSPVQSSLRLVCLQFGQTGPALIIRQFLQALSVNFYAPPSGASPSNPLGSIPVGLGKADEELCQSCPLNPREGN